MKRIMFVLNNQEGSPAVEAIYILGISLLCTYSLIKFMNNLYTWIPNLLTFIANA